MSREPSGIIRKLVWGFIENQTLSVCVGTKVRGDNSYLISEIVEDKDAFMEFGKIEYLVFVTKDKDNHKQFLWKRLFNPDIIEYEIPKDIEVKLY